MAERPRFRIMDLVVLVAASAVATGRRGRRWTT